MSDSDLVINSDNDEEINGDDESFSSSNNNNNNDDFSDGSRLHDFPQDINLPEFLSHILNSFKGKHRKVMTNTLKTIGGILEASQQEKSPLAFFLCLLTSISPSQKPSIISGSIQLLYAFSIENLYDFFLQYYSKVFCFFFFFFSF